MKVGILLATRDAATKKDASARVMRSLVELAAELDAVGFDSVWVGDSLLGRPRPEPLSVLAAMAARTRRITLGTAALLPAMREPLRLAQQVATVDLISDGRLVLGVGTGFPNDQTRRELDALGIPFESRVARCHEVMAWCRSLWGGAAPEKPEHWHLPPDLEIEPAPAQPGGPKLWLGGATPRTLRRAARTYDGWMPTSPDPDGFAEGAATVRAAARDAGRTEEDVVLSTLLTVSIDPDADTAERRLRRFIEGYYSVPLEAVRLVVGCRSGDLERLVREDVAAFAEAGVQHLVLRLAGDDQEATLGRWAGELLESIHRHVA